MKNTPLNKSSRQLLVEKVLALSVATLTIDRIKVVIAGFSNTDSVVIAITAVLSAEE